jgi:hypothetical protein
MSYKIPKLEEIYDKIDLEQGRPMSQDDGYQWSLDYLNDIQKQLQKLEKKALDQNNPALYQNVRLSMQRSLETQQEITDKIKGLRK